MCHYGVGYHQAHRYLQCLIPYERSLADLVNLRLVFEFGIRTSLQISKENVFLLACAAGCPTMPAVPVQLYCFTDGFVAVSRQTK